MSYRFTSTIDLRNGADLDILAGDTFRFNPDRPEYFFQNNHYVKVGIVSNPEEFIWLANSVSNLLKRRAIAFYRGYKFPKSCQAWQVRERLHPSVAEVIWNYYHKT